MPNFDPVSTAYPMMPISSASSLESLYREPVLVSDSIVPMDADSHSIWTPERPILTPPNSLPPVSDSVYRLLAATDESRSLGNEILDTLGRRLQNVKLKIREISADNIQKLKEAAQRAADSSFWSILKKIATCLVSAVSIVFGISLVATGGGALIGGTMIASGILSLSNFAMSETGAWNWVSKQLSNDNEERQKMLAWVLPSAVGIIAGGIGLVGSVQGVVSGALHFAEKAVYIAQTALAIFDGVTTIGKGYADARSIWAQSDVSKIQADLTVERTHFDNVMREIEGSMNDFRAVKAKTKKIVQTLSQSNVQLVRQI
jgi:hypothetical protein